MNEKILKRLLDPMKRKISLGISRAIVKSVQDAFKIQRVQIALFKDEVRDSVERFQEYGFTSVPKEGAEAVTVFMGGDRSHGIVIAVDDRRYRLKDLKGGEVALYSDEGDSVILKRGREIEVTTTKLTIKASTSVTLDTPKVTANHDMEIKGKLDVTGNIASSAQINDGTGSMGGMRSTYNGHVHPETGTTTQTTTQTM